MRLGVERLQCFLVEVVDSVSRVWYLCFGALLETTLADDSSESN